MYTSRLKNARTDALVRMLISLDTEEDCYRVLEDLLTIREVNDLAQRLEVAFLLREGATYAEIVEKTGVSTATIGRVNRCIHYGAGGYQRIFEKMTEENI
jgi:TrpR-related protein YerC/YecD